MPPLCLSFQGLAGNWSAAIVEVVQHCPLIRALKIVRFIGSVKTKTKTVNRSHDSLSRERLQIQSLVNAMVNWMKLTSLLIARLHRSFIPRAFQEDTHW